MSRAGAAATTTAAWLRAPIAAVVAMLCTLLLALSACTGGDDAPAGPTTGSSASGAGPSSGVLRVLGGSEVKDMAPVLAEAKKATGVEVRLTEIGTLEGSEQVASGAAARSYDATWFSSNRYLGLLPKGNEALSASTSIMSSPVVLGVRASKAHELGWDAAPPTWAQIGAASASGRFTYGMTNPASSNSGFSALVGVATALAGGGAALDAARIKAVTPRLSTFFTGQKLTSGSSGWLAQRFVEQSAAGGVDGLVNYESVLLGLNAAGSLPEPLTIVRPKDGVVSGDYPLGLLAGAGAQQSADYRKLVDWLRTPDAQRLVMERTHRRPVVPGVRPAAEFGTGLLVELPFPAQRAAADGLIATYLDKARRPTRTIYVLDTSGSMAGDRLASLKSAFALLAGRGTNGGGAGDGFSRFRERESVTILPFASAPGTPRSFEVATTDADASRARITTVVDGLDAGGRTAIYSSLAEAYTVAAKDVAAHPEAFTSIVLMTDGENTDGVDVDRFLAVYDALPAAAKAVPTFPIVFGEGDPGELTQVAEHTHGKVFDARTASLPSVFKEIRGYQ